MPITSFFNTRSPIVSTTLQAVCINVCANLFAQYLEARHQRAALASVDKNQAPWQFDALRVLQFVIWTLISVPPNFRWQQYLERRFPAYYEEKTVKTEEEGVPVTKAKARNFKHTLLKILCDQGFAAPINCSLFLFVMTALKGGTIIDCAMAVHDRFWALKFAGWRLWPFVGLFNFTFVPVERRIIVSTCVGFCWQVFLALFIS